jgi:two-component system, NtrC family, sensor kinase
MFTTNSSTQNHLKPDRSPAIDRSIGDEFVQNLIPETRIKVLLIDDQRMVSEILQRTLSKETDIDFHYCSDPTIAITMAIDLAPTVILQDLVMPDVDGLMLLRWFRLNPLTKDIPMIVLSCKEDAHLKAEAFTYGANDYLIKLPDVIELIARIRYHAQAYNNLQALQSAKLAAQEQAQRLVNTLAQVQIAYEINSPTHAIHDNAQHLGEHLDSLLNLVTLYQSTYPQPTEAIQRLSQNIDIPFISSDLPKRLESLKVDSERLQNLVLSLEIQ